MPINIIKVFLPTAVALFVGVLITPIATHFFYKYKLWKKYSRSSTVSSSDFQKIHNEKEELHTPRVGGIIVWMSVFLTTFLFFILSVFFPSDLTEKLNFFSRNQTLVLVLTLAFGALVGLFDDLIQVYGNGKIARDAKSWRKWKALLIVLMSLCVALWFFVKLDVSAIHIPFSGAEFELGWLFIPFFILVTLATFSGGVIDGIDGLSGGVLASIFSAYAVIAYTNNQIDLAAFSGVLAGSTLAFLWFNIPPARFYMGETGMMALTVTLATLAFLTDSVLILPVVAMPLVVTSSSVILQMFYKKLTNGKKLFRVAPIHHHFEAIGWPSHKVTMRFWIFGVAFAIVGVILSIISK